MTKDSMATLPACIDSLEFCDEIIVVDDYSTDGTWEYLATRAPKVSAFQRQLDSFSAQRRALHERVNGKWMLILDADEVATEELAREIESLLAGAPRHVAYRVPQKNVLPRAWARPVWFWTSMKRLLETDAVRWEVTPWIHAPATYSGSTGRLRAGIIHYAYDSVNHLMRKQISYGRNGALQYHAEGRKSSLFHLLWHPTSTFLKYYGLKGLFRFGAGGFLVAAAQALHAFQKYAVLWELRTRRDEIEERGKVPLESDRT
jgi:glycosyltransferase involved in cell wall biosynthesis